MRADRLRAQLADARGGPLNEDIIAASVCPGEGLFIEALRRRLAASGASVPMRDHDLLAELGVSRV